MLRAARLEKEGWRGREEREGGRERREGEGGSYADVCMLTYADVTYADVCGRESYRLSDASVRETIALSLELSRLASRDQPCCYRLSDPSISLLLSSL
jgi:hypothetical protein